MGGSQKVSGCVGFSRYFMLLDEQADSGLAVQ